MQPGLRAPPGRSSQRTVQPLSSPPSTSPAAAILSSPLCHHGRASGDRASTRPVTVSEIVRRVVIADDRFTVDVPSGTADGARCRIVGRLCAGCLKPTVANRPSKPSGPPHHLANRRTDAGGMIHRSTLASGLRRRVATARNGRSHHPSYAPATDRRATVRRSQHSYGRTMKAATGFPNHHAPSFVSGNRVDQPDCSLWSGLMARTPIPHPEEADTRRGDRHDRSCWSGGRLHHFRARRRGRLTTNDLYCNVGTA
jgi:hypothetical protein